jgi:hypothetical protein
VGTIGGDKKLKNPTAAISKDQKLQLYALVAQGIEHRIPNPGVACSNHAGGTNKKYSVFS